MSPILVRPVREQLEHDRIIRLLQAKYKRKFDVAINPGNEQSAPVGTGPSAWFPDLVLQERGRKLAGVVEVETTESVNNLEAMSQWAAFGKMRTQFHLYVPTTSIDSARRLCGDLGISVAEMWAYHFIGDQPRFTLVQKSAAAQRSVSGNGGAAGVSRAGAAAKTARPAAGSQGGASAKKAKAAPAAKKPAAKAKSAAARKPLAKTAPAKAAPARTAPVKAAPAKGAKKKAPAASRPVKRR